MSISFPTSLDTLLNPAETTVMNAAGYEHDVQHSNLNDIVEALEAKVGVTGSAVATSLDYLVSNTLLKLDQTVPQTIINGPLHLDSIVFDVTDTPQAGVEGLLQWNATDGTLDLTLASATMQMGQEMFTKVVNKTGSIIPDGSVVYFVSRQGIRPTIGLAQGNAEATSKVAGVTTQAIGINAEGFITTMGYVRGIKTDYPTWAEGDTLWVSTTTPGALTNEAPTAPNHSDIVGSVGIVHKTQGSILIALQRHLTFTELCDVNGTALTVSGQIAVWNNTAGYFDYTANINNYLLLDQTTAQPIINGPLTLANAYGSPVSVDATGFMLAASANVDKPAGIECKNIHAGTSADIRFAMVCTDGNYTSFALPGLGNTVAAMFGVARATGTFLFNANAGTPRHIGIGTLGATNLTFGTTNAARMTILATGNIGIGTILPAASLDILNGTGSDTPGTNPILGIMASATQGFVFQYNAAVSTLSVNRLYSSAWSNVLTLSRATGFVGLGIAPLALLHENITDTSGVGLLITGKSKDTTTDTSGVAIVMTHNATNNRQFWIGDYTSALGVRYACGASTVSMGGWNYTGASEINFNINPITTALTTVGYPSYLARLTVHNLSGVVAGNNAAVKVLSVVGDTGQTADMLNVHIHGATAGSLFTILASGLIGIGFSAPTSQLQVKGSDAVSSTVALTISNPAVSADATNNKFVMWIQAYSANIASGVTESGYRYGIRIDAFIQDAAFAGTLTAQIANTMRHGIYQVAASGARTVVTSTGLQITTFTVADSTITTSYGLFIQRTAVTGGGTITNDWAIYQNSTISNNALAGKTRFGGVTAPTVAVDVTGTAMATIFQLRDTAIGIYSQADSFMDIYADGAVRIGNSAAGAPTNYTKFEPDGTMVMVGDATVWDDLRVPTTAVKAAGVKDPHFSLYKTNGAGSTGVFIHWFDKAAEEELFFTCQMPHGWVGTDITAHVHWVPKTNGALNATVEWGLEYTWADIGGTFGNSTIIYTKTTTSGDATLVADKHYMSNFTAIANGSHTISSMLVCRIFRNATDATDDTYDDDAGLLEIDFHYEADMVGSRGISTK